MRPVFPGEPEEVRRRLRAPYSESWTHVLIGETKQVVTISEYIHQEKWDDVVRHLDELVKKAQMPMYQRDKSKLQSHVLRTARRILDIAKEGEK